MPEVKVNYNKDIAMKRFRHIKSRVTYADFDRLNAIKEKYGFKSVYEILNYLVHCFLRVADPDNDPITEPLPAEIEEMFSGFTDAEGRYKGEKPKRRCNTTIDKDIDPMSKHI